jgi:hypothetical protein
LEDLYRFRETDAEKWRTAGSLWFNERSNYDKALKHRVAQSVYLSAPPSIGAYFPSTFKGLSTWNTVCNCSGNLATRTRTGNPLCHNACFSSYESGTFGAGTLSDPYTSAQGGPINPNNYHPFPKVEAGNFQARFGFNYSFDTKTEIRGGVGVFSDLYPASFLDGVIQNFPNYFTPPITTGIVSPSGTGNIVSAYSHSLDTVSNGGTGLGWNGGAVTTQITPDLHAYNLNYSNSDYDIRHNLTADFVYEEPFKTKYGVVNQFVGGWVLGGKTYYRSGEPFSMLTSQSGNYTQLGPMTVQTVSGGKLTNLAASDPHSCVVNANCFDATQYVPVGSQTTFGNVRRNAFYGPHYVNTDLSLLKNVFKRETLAFSIGANAYNIWNHANFASPGSTLGSSTYGTISSVAPPTSPYGSFQSAAVTQRVLQVHGKFTF